MNPHLDFDEKEIHEMEREVEELNEKYDRLDLEFKEPLTIFSPMKITYKGEKIGLLSRNIIGTLKIKKEDGEYVVENDSLYDLGAPFEENTVL